LLLLLLLLLLMMLERDIRITVAKNTNTTKEILLSFV